MTKTAPDSKKKRKRPHEMVTKSNSFALKDRVAYSGKNGDARVSAASLPLYTFLPCQQDYAMLKKRMVVIVQRILREHTALYRTAQAEDHIPHKSATETCLKSEFVSCPQHFCKDVLLCIMKYINNRIISSSSILPY